ncbi:MAG: hypothetical protein IJM71_07820 [Clostridia bacterium]|nr:hypothetical protein [Clostridia bacterium]
MAFKDLFRRQSGPKPTAEEYLAGMQTNDRQATPAEAPLDQPIGTEAIRNANTILGKYQSGKKTLDLRIVENEKWYRITNTTQKNEVKRRTAWLFNMVANKHAEAMDNYPRADILPREEGDEAQAKMLSSVIPVVMKQAKFERTYSSEQMYKLKQGCGVYGVFWDGTKLNGLGDVAINKIDLLNLFWEPGVHDIQDSPNLFLVRRVDNDTLEAKYPQLRGKLSTESLTVTDYEHDDTIDNSTKSSVVDWYYKRFNGQKTVLHYCKYVDDTILYASENDPRLRKRGFYDHGLYPFVFDVLYGVEDGPTGIGFIDIGRSPQQFIDLGAEALMKNLLQGAKPRFFERIDGTINEEEFADWTKDVVHVTGNLGEDSIRPIQPFPLSGVYVDVINQTVDELKETTGNRDVSTGGTTSGVTAASGIAAMQEAGAKLARDMNKSSYQAFDDVVNLVIELIRQFYDTERTFRILGEKGTREYISFSNQGLKLQPNGFTSEGEQLYRLPVFDIEVTAEKESPYTRMAQNELILDFWNRQFFNPQLAAQAVLCLQMMDFPGKDKIIAAISRQGDLVQQLFAMAAALDEAKGGNEATMGLYQQFGMTPPSQPTEGTNVGEESPVTKNARERVAQSTEVR